MISLSVGTSLEKSVQGHLVSDSESSAVVESRVHFKKKWSHNSVPWDQNARGPKCRGTISETISGSISSVKEREVSLPL